LPFRAFTPDRTVTVSTAIGTLTSASGANRLSWVAGSATYRFNQAASVGRERQVTAIKQRCSRSSSINRFTTCKGHDLIGYSILCGVRPRRKVSMGSTTDCQSPTHGRWASPSRGTIRAPAGPRLGESQLAALAGCTAGSLQRRRRVPPAQPSGQSEAELVVPSDHSHSATCLRASPRLSGAS